jgi:hypothetical protein
MARILALPEVDGASVQNLEGYAEATLKANADYMTSVAPPAVLAGVLEEADALRDDLLDDAQVLLRRKLLPAGSLSEVRGSSGYRNTAVELSALVSVLEKAWPDIEGKTAITRQEIDRASVLAQHIFRNAIEREGRQERHIELTRLRQQAFTTLSRAYDQLRRCVAYLFPRPGEADQIAPSFYQGRGGRPALAAEVEAPALAGNVTGNAGAAVGTVANTTSNEAPAANAPSNPNALPSNSPFSS